MSSHSKDNFGNWCKFTFGSFLFCAGATSLFHFFAYGYADFGPSNRFPFELTGESAALVYVVYFVSGILLGISGIKGLLSK